MTAFEVQAVQEQTERYLTQVLEGFRRQHPDKRFASLAAEVDPSAGSLYVYVCDDRHDPAQPAAYWPYAYAEQEVAAVVPPAWFAAYDELQRQYYQEDVIPYEEVEAALAAILEGVSRALAELERSHALTRFGFDDEPALHVWTEDDEDETTGCERVARYRSRETSSP